MKAALLRAATIALFAFSAASAQAQVSTLYKWTDRDGKVQYSDKLPTGFKGEVERIEIDSTTNTTALPGYRAPAAVRPPAGDINSERRVRREQLQANLDRARAKLDLAKASLAVAGGPDDDERQVIQQRYATQVPGTASARANCRAVKQDGATSYTCPAVIPNESFYERIDKLESAVREAEADVAAAEEAYRRGVD